MSSTCYCVDPEVFAKFPGYRRSIVIATGVTNGVSPPELVAMIRQEEERLRADMEIDFLASHPRIGCWRDAYRSFGAKPSEFRSSVEALARRVLHGDSLPLINTLVDIGTLMCLRYRIPVGAHPLGASADPLEIRFAREGDSFLPSNQGPSEAVPGGELIFAQGQRVLTRRWTWRQAAGEQTLPQTRSLYFNLDALAPVSDGELGCAENDLSQMIVQFCGGTVSRERLDTLRPGVRIEPARG